MTNRKSFVLVVFVILVVCFLIRESINYHQKVCKCLFGSSYEYSFNGWCSNVSEKKHMSAVLTTNCFEESL